RRQRVAALPARHLPATLGHDPGRVRLPGDRCARHVRDHPDHADRGRARPGRRGPGDLSLPRRLRPERLRLRDRDRGHALRHQVRVPGAAAAPDPPRARGVLTVLQAREIPALERRWLRAGLSPRTAGARLLIYTLLCLWALAVIFPLVWLVYTSFKTDQEI